MYTLIRLSKHLDPKKNLVHFEAWKDQWLEARNPSLSEQRKAEIMQQVNELLTRHAETDPKHEALKLTMDNSLDPILRDPQKVLELIQYAQEKWATFLTIIALSKRFALLTNDQNYLDQIGHIENNYFQERDQKISTDHTGTMELKSVIENKIETDEKTTAHKFYLWDIS